MPIKKIKVKIKKLETNNNTTEEEDIDDSKKKDSKIKESQIRESRDTKSKDDAKIKPAKINANGIIEPFGIQNIGNTCYMNSALQCLLSLSLFIKNINNIIKKSENANLLEAFQKFLVDHKAGMIKRLISNKNDTFCGFNQQDTFQFTLTFIDSIIDESPKMISKYFIGQIRTIRECTKCTAKNERIDNFSSINLSIHEARRIIYVPYSFTKNPICMTKIPVVSESIKIRENKNLNIKINKFVLMAKMCGRYQIIDKILPNYSEIYAFELPKSDDSEEENDDEAYIVIQIKTKDKIPITLPFICKIPTTGISENDLKSKIIERTKLMIPVEDRDKTKKLKSSFTFNRIKRFPCKFTVNETNPKGLPKFCKSCFTITVNDTHVFDTDRRVLKKQKSQINLLDLFNSHISQTQIEPPCKYTCDDCGFKTRVFQRIQYVKLPKVLIFLIMRNTSSYDYNAIPDDTEVSFPQTISITEIVSKNEGDKDELYKKYNIIKENPKGNEGKKYELKGISHHMGTFNSGHYWADGKRGDEWYEFNDSSYNSREEPIEATKSSYVVFYQQIETDDTKDDDEGDEIEDENEKDEEYEKGSSKKKLDEIEIDEDDEKYPGFVEPFGIKKIKNTCYTSAALQCLLSMSSFIRRIDNLVKKIRVAGVLKEFYNFIICRNPKKIRELVAKKNKALLGYLQQDSFEFIISFINSITKECLTDISNIFITKHRTLSLCTKCGIESIPEISDFSASISLSFPETKRVIYVPYSLRRHPILMTKIPNKSKSIKVCELNRETKIKKFILVAKTFMKKETKYQIIDEILPEYSEVYAFELPDEDVDNEEEEEKKEKNGFVVVRLKYETKEQITIPFICKVPLKKIKEDKLKDIIYERLSYVIDEEVNNETKIKKKMIIKKPEPIKGSTYLFKTENDDDDDDDDDDKSPSLCTTYITVHLKNDDFVNFDKRIPRNQKTGVDFLDLFKCRIQKKQIQVTCKCENCEEEMHAYQRTQYVKLPKILIFHIQRIVDISVTNAMPDETEVYLPLAVSIKEVGNPKKFNEIKEIDPNDDKQDKNNSKYELIAVVYHKGSFSGGHYWVDAKRGSKWYEIDDDKVKLIDGPNENKKMGYSSVVVYQKIKDEIEKSDDEEEIDES